MQDFILNLENIADKHHTEEAECIFNPVVVPIGPISSSHSFCLGFFGRPVADQTKCVCFQIFPYCLGIYHALMHNLSICKLQHISGYWQDIPGNISSSWPPQDFLGSCLWVYIVA
ncbi:hypothetical protein HRI_002187500 [Hibiscus trionum]|uniref:Uncharacterized protein n=1 Tax=Hibiscus trionum TaxID=183268 RepID=A0A9W7HYC1_HIBTR|nr:hypothetical protein HRI_002187500 [Hibiscus trionum]